MDTCISQNDCVIDSITAFPDVQARLNVSSRGLEIMQTLSFEAGGYRFIKGVFQYSAGVAAAHGYRIVRVQFRWPVPLAEGFRRIERMIIETGRPLSSFCACELRSPAPFTEAGFADFNKIYVGTLTRWGIFDGTTNPVARSNVCPAIDPPAKPSFHAFGYTEVSEEGAPSFIVAGSGEAPEGQGSYRDRAIRLGDTSPDGLRAKALFVLGEMERRLAALGYSWDDTTATQIYTVHDIHPFLADEIARRGAARSGVIWHYNRPPVEDLEYEMDCRSIGVERVV
jgi:hypothetical protein